MMQIVEAWWPLFLIALVLGIAIAWWAFASSRRTQVIDRSGADVLDEGAAPAARNQALIDAAPAAEPPMPPAVPPGVAGAGTAVAAVVEAQQVKAAEEAAQVDETPPPAAAPSATPAQVAGDDLTRIKGVGGKLNELLASLGVTSFAQIAAWSEADIDRIDANLGRFQGRIRRDSWVEQARLLSAGDSAAYEARFGRL